MHVNHFREVSDFGGIIAGCPVQQQLFRTYVFQVLHGPPDQELNGKQVRVLLAEAAMPVLPPQR